MSLPDQTLFIKLSAPDTVLIFAPDTDTLEIVRMATEVGAGS